MKMQHHWLNSWIGWVEERWQRGHSWQSIYYANVLLICSQETFCKNTASSLIVKGHLRWKFRNSVRFDLRDCPPGQPIPTNCKHCSVAEKVTCYFGRSVYFLMLIQWNTLLCLVPPLRPAPLVARFLKTLLASKKSSPFQRSNAKKQKTKAVYLSRNALSFFIHACRYRTKTWLTVEKVQFCYITYWKASFVKSSAISGDVFHNTIIYFFLLH